MRQWPFHHPISPIRVVVDGHTRCDMFFYSHSTFPQAKCMIYKKKTLLWICGLNICLWTNNASVKWICSRFPTSAAMSVEVNDSWPVTERIHDRPTGLVLSLTTNSINIISLVRNLLQTQVNKEQTQPKRQKLVCMGKTLIFTCLPAETQRGSKAP